MGGGLVQHQDARLFVERSRQKKPLFLSARKRRSHIADQRVRSHGHIAYIPLQSRLSKTPPDAIHVDFLVEERHVVCNRACEKFVVLEY